MIVRILHFVKKSCFAVFVTLVFLFSAQILMAQSDSVKPKKLWLRNWKLSDYLQIHGFVDAQYDYTRQRENDPGEYRQLDYCTGLPMTEAQRKKRG